MSRAAKAAGIVPGLVLCVGLALAAGALGRLEALLLGRAWVEPMVIAILLGALVRNLFGEPKLLKSGVRFSAKTLLDVAVALLGVTLSAAALVELGLKAVVVIALVVAAAMVLIPLLGRKLGLGPRLALLIAAGNAICGNSAIAAVAPAIGAREEEVAAAISLTAISGVIVVLLLPFAVWWGHASLERYAMLAGLTVYAVPQVIAAAAGFGAATVTLATFVKLTRVMMLGPVTMALSLLAPRLGEEGAEAKAGGARVYLPWFIIAFALLAIARNLGWVPQGWVAPIGLLANLLAVVAMAALGMGVRLASLIEVGPRVAAATVGANLVMIALAVAALFVI